MGILLGNACRFAPRTNQLMSIGSDLRAGHQTWLQFGIHLMV